MSEQKATNCTALSRFETGAKWLIAIAWRFATHRHTRDVWVAGLPRGVTTDTFATVCARYKRASLLHACNKA